MDDLIITFIKHPVEHLNIEFWHSTAQIIGIDPYTVCQSRGDSSIHRDIIFKEILCNDRRTCSHFRPDVFKPVWKLFIFRMMIDADDLVPRNVNDVWITLLCIHKDHFILICQNGTKILHIQKFDLHQFTQLVGTVTVYFSFITDRGRNSIVL